MFRQTVALLALMAAPALAAPVDLAPKFEIGRATRYRYNSETSQQFLVGGRVQGAASSTSDTRATLTVESADEHGAVIIVVFDSALIELDSPGLNVLFDSGLPAERDPDSPLSPAIRSFLGKPIRCVVGRDGSLIRVESDYSFLPTEDRARRLAQQYLSEPNLRWLVDAVYVVKPDEPTANIGDSWTRTRTEQHPLGTLRIEHTYTLDKDDAGIAEVSIKGTDEVQKLLGVGAGQGAENVEHSPGEITGSLRWDGARGHADRFQLTTKSEDIERHPQHGEIRKLVTQSITVERIN